LHKKDGNDLDNQLFILLLQCINALFYMQTKQQYIDYWVNTAEDDWESVEILFQGKKYLHCLFWSHLVLEKLAKAIWIKTHEDNIPPKVHNIAWLFRRIEHWI
jgi:HEPN domain-containing protein